MCVAVPTDRIFSEGSLKVWSLLEHGMEQLALVAKGDLGKPSQL